MKRLAKAGAPGVCALAVLALTSSATAAQEGPVEEIIVTGSYLRGTPEDAASPVEVVTREDIEIQGAVLPSDVIKNLTINTGSTTNLNTDAENGNIAGKGNVNLRGLGVNSTLVLLNGKRQTVAAARTQAGETFVDIDEIPFTMIERVEVLKNGASATYGSDAIAGVVNFITRDDYEGFEVSGRYTDTDNSGQRDAHGGVVWGWASDDQRTNLVIGADYLDRTNMLQAERALAEPGLLTTSGIYGARVTRNLTAAAQGATVGFTGALQGAGFLPPDPPGAPGAVAAALYPNAFDRNTAFVTLGGSDYTDPACQAAGGFTGVDGDPTRAECRFDTRTYSDYVPDVRRAGGMAAFSHAFTPAAEVYAELLYTDTRLYQTRSGVTSPVGTNFLQLPVGVPLYGLGSITPDGSPRTGLTAADQLPMPANAPNLAANGGFDNLVTMDFSVGEYGEEERVRNDSTTERYLLGLRGDFQLGDRPSNYDISYSYSTNDSIRREKSLDKDRMELALNGLGGPNCTPNGVSNLPLLEDPTLGAFWGGLGFFLRADLDPEYATNSRGIVSQALSSTNQGQGGCMFFNPYLSAITGTGPANDPTLLEWMTIPAVVLNNSTTELHVVDAVFSTELWQMDAGPVGAAVGFQYRQNSRESTQQRERFGTTLITAVNPTTGATTERPVANDALYGTLTNVFDATQEAYSVFAELAIPVTDTFELNLAARYEDISLETNFAPESLSFQGALDNVDEDLGSEVTSKISFRWQAVDQLALRGSFGQSFRAPNLGLLFEGSGYDGAATIDPLALREVQNGTIDPATVYADPALSAQAIRGFLRLGLPSPELGPEKADSYNFGFIWTPGGVLENLQIKADYFRIDYEDAIVPTPFRDRLDLQIAQFNAAKQDPGNYVMFGDLTTPCAPGSSADCIVSPDAYFIPAQPGAPAPVERIGTSLAIVRINDINAGSIETDGVDLEAAYTFDTEVGTFGFDTQWTWINKYEVDAAGTLYDAAGHTNDEFATRSMPDLNGNATLSWGRGNHLVAVIARYIDSYHDDLNDDSIGPYTTVDAQYNLTWNWSENVPPLSLRLGVIDLFDEDIPRREGIGRGFDTTVFDPTGRQFYLQFTQAL